MTLFYLKHAKNNGFLVCIYSLVLNFPKKYLSTTTKYVHFFYNVTFNVCHFEKKCF